MKASKFIWVVSFLLMGCFTSELFAQKQLETVVKKLETDKSVDKSVIQQRDPKTKVLTQIIRSFQIEGKPSLVQEVKKALEQDREDAYQVIENESGGDVNYFCQFSKEKGSISYSLNFSGKADECVITIIENFGEPGTAKKPETPGVM